MLAAGHWKAAEAICSSDDVAAEDVVDAVLQLVRKSLVSRIDDGRYGLLETLREYASDKLRGRGAELSATRDRHAAFYSDLVQRFDPSSATKLLPYSNTEHTVRVYEVLDDAHDNVRVALRWMLEARRATEGLMLIRALVPLWWWRAVPADGRQWLEAMLELADRESDSVPPALRALAVFFGGAMARLQGDMGRARELIETSVALWRSLDDQVGLAMSLGSLGLIQACTREFQQADFALTESLELARGSGSTFVICVALNTFSTLACAQGQSERATTMLRESLALGRTLERAADRGQAVGRALILLGRALSEQGHVDEAMVVLKEALAELRGLGMTGMTLAQGLEWIAPLVATSGDPLRAARLFGAADALWRASGATRYPPDEQAYERDVQAVKEQLDDQLFEDALAEGRAMTATQAISHALGEA